MEIDFVHCCDLAERPAFAWQLDCLAADDLANKMDAEKHARIQATLWRHPFSKLGLRLWSLKKEGEVIALFETFDVIVRRRTREGIDRQRGLILTSVIAGTKHRKGYSRHFAGEISRRMASEGYTLLYGVAEASIKIAAEIQPETRQVTISIWPALQVPPQGVRSVSDLAEWTDSPLLGDFDVLITPEMLDWRFERVRLEFPKDAQRPIGARFGSGWIVWSSSYARDALRILHLRTDEGTASTLIDAARHEAAQRGLSKVQAWNNPASVSLFAGAEQQTLKDIFALRSFVPDLSLSMWPDPQLGHDF